MRQVKRGTPSTQPIGGRSCDCCGGFNGNIQLHRLCFSRVGRARWRMIRSGELWSRQENWRVCRFPLMRICSGMGRGTIWRIKGWTRARFRHTWGIATFNIRSGTLSWHPDGSRDYGRIDCLGEGDRPLVNEQLVAEWSIS